MDVKLVWIITRWHYGKVSFSKRKKIQGVFNVISMVSFVCNGNWCMSDFLWPSKCSIFSKKVQELKEYWAIVHKTPKTTMIIQQDLNLKLRSTIKQEYFSFCVDFDKAINKNNQRGISRLKVKPLPRLNQPTLEPSKPLTPRIILKLSLIHIWRCRRRG